LIIDDGYDIEGYWINYLFVIGGFKNYFLFRMSIFDHRSTAYRII